MESEFLLPTEGAGPVVSRELPSFPEFARRVVQVEMTPFHESYYRILDRFARGDIRRLIVTVPPQHGKSLGASVLLPAYMLGIDPDLRICIGSYALTLAGKFNRQIQRIIESAPYRALFPATTLKAGGTGKGYIRTSDEFEIVGHGGGMLFVGREGSLTGNNVDIMVLDDLYKDAMEANSPLVRENCWEWYTSVVRTRLHNDSRELVVFTRWHEEDVIGLLMKKEPFIVPKTFEELDGISPDTWVIINFEALKEGPSTAIDPRRRGEALWPGRHSVRLLKDKRQLNPPQFEGMYQGRPVGRSGYLYGDHFKVYDAVPEDTVRKANYTDTADMGDDYLCSVCYQVDKRGDIYVVDVVFTQQPMEVTEVLVAEMLDRNATRIAHVESNNGGRGFARAVQKLVGMTAVRWFNQNANKEARILTNSATVLRHIRMPRGWEVRWEAFHHNLATYKKEFRSNRTHDAADVLTGIVEMELAGGKGSASKAWGFSK